MSIITLERSIHPVGDGAFYSEVFESNGLANEQFVTVYDCGSNTKSAIKSQINDSKNELNTKINLLFISHFDKDHISGVKELIQTGLLDSSTNVFIPLLVHFDTALGDKLSIEYSSLLNLFKEKSIQERFILPYQNDVKTQELDQFIFPNMVRVSNEKDINSDTNSNKPIPSGTKIRSVSFSKGGFQPFWEYIPFHICDDSVYNEFIQKVNASGLDFDKLISDPCYIFDTNNCQTLKDIYQNVGKGSNEVTRRNVNSLLLMSRMDETCSLVNNISYICFSQNQFRMLPGWLKCSYNVDSTSCLYTGDSTITNPNMSLKFFDCCKHMGVYKGGRKIALFQVPHHGSRYNYNYALHNIVDIDVGFYCRSTDTKKSTFDKNIVCDFVSRNKIIYMVNENKNSKLTQIIKISLI